MLALQLPAKENFRGAPGASALFGTEPPESDHDSELGDPPLTPAGAPLDLKATRARLSTFIGATDAGNDSTAATSLQPSLNLAALEPRPNLAVFGHSQADSLDGSSALMSIGNSAPSADLSCREVTLEVKDSEDEDSDSEMLQIQQALLEAKARLQKLQESTPVADVAC